MLTKEEGRASGRCVNPPSCNPAAARPEAVSDPVRIPKPPPPTPFAQGGVKESVRLLRTKNPPYSFIAWDAVSFYERFQGPLRRAFALKLVSPPFWYTFLNTFMFYVILENCTLRPGSTLLIGVHGLLRHPMWGPESDKFRPERWLDPASLPKHPSINAAFGLGKRNCIGTCLFIFVVYYGRVIAVPSF